MNDLSLVDDYSVKWSKCDRLIHQKMAELSVLRNQKQELTIKLLPFLLRKSLNQENSLLKVVEKKKYTPLTFKFLQQCLYECTDDIETTNAVMQYVKANRQLEQSYDIVSSTKV